MFNYIKRGNGDNLKYETIIKVSVYIYYICSGTQRRKDKVGTYATRVAARRHCSICAIVVRWWKSNEDKMQYWAMPGLSSRIRHTVYSARTFRVQSAFCPSSTFYYLWNEIILYKQMEAKKAEVIFQHCAILYFKRFVFQQKLFLVNLIKSVLRIYSCTQYINKDVVHLCFEQKFSNFSSSPQLQTAQ